MPEPTGYATQDARCFIADPDGNNLELIQRFRRWDEWREDRRRQELPPT